MLAVVQSDYWLLISVIDYVVMRACTTGTKMSLLSDIDCMRVIGWLARFLNPSSSVECVDTVGSYQNVNERILCNRMRRILTFYYRL